MINSNFFLALPINFKNKCKVYPALIKDVVGNEKFGLYRRLLTYSQEELEDEFQEKMKDSKEDIKIPTPFEFILSNAFYDKDFEQTMKDAFKFFIKRDVTFLYEEKAILIGKLEEEVMKMDSPSAEFLVVIREEEFFDFQNLIRESLGEKAIEKPNPNEDPRIKRIKAKSRYRDKIKAKLGKGISLGSFLAAICCMGIGINPLNIGDMSYTSMLDIISMYQEKEKYDTDIRCIIAGGDSKKIQPKYWINNLDK